jgi:hypothetical protein
MGPPGRPIVWLCDTRGLGSGSAADVRAFTDTLRSRARQRLGEELLIISNRDLVVDRAATGVDGQYCSARFEAADIAGSYRRYVDGQRWLFGLDAPVYMRCVMSNFDERPRYPILQRDPAKIRWFPDQTLGLFAQAARNVRDDIDASARPPTIDNLALVYAWNEYHEGGVVEPNAKEGCAYLDVLRREWRLTSGAGCIARPTAP